MASTRHQERLSMGVGALLTLAEAAALIPIADMEARAWLKAQGLVQQLKGRHVVTWRSVLDAVEGLPESR